MEEIYNGNSLIGVSDGLILKIRLGSFYDKYNNCNRAIDEINYNSILDNYEYIVKLLKLSYNSDIFTEKYKDKYDNIVLYFEKADSTLNIYNKNVAIQLVEGLNYIHSKGLVHGDIKLTNLFLFDNKVKYGDLGSCRYVNDNIQEINTTLKAPESYETIEYIYNYKSDIFALGMTLYLLNNKYIIFSGPEQNANLPGITLDLFIKQFSEYEEDIESLINIFNNRKELLNNENNLLNDLIRKMIQYDYNKRIDLKDIMTHPYFEGYIFKEFKLEKAERNKLIKNTDKIYDFIKILIDLKFYNFNFIISCLELCIRYLNNIDIYDITHFYIIINMIIKLYHLEYKLKLFDDNINEQAKLLLLFNYVIRPYLFIDERNIINNVDFLNYLLKQDFNNKTLEELFDKFN